MKRILYVLLTLVFCLALLAACGKQDGNKKPTSPKDMLFLVQDGSAMVQIIRSDKLDANDTETKCAVNIMSAVRETTGVKLSVNTDYTGAGGTPETEYEILVGNTERPESKTALEKMGDKDYAICVVGTKLCIVARNGLCLKYATEQFFENYLYYEDGNMFISKKLDVLDMFVLDENLYLLAPAAGGADRRRKYDESVAIACLQGIMNRESPNKVYLNDNKETPKWLEVLQEEGRWLENQEFLELSSFTELLELSLNYVKKVIIWDPNVPATVNVACTVAGVEDGVVMTQEMYDQYKDILTGKEVFSLVGMFTGEELGSAKNEAYRWAIENYLEKGLCSTDYLCSYIDSYSFRTSGNTSYTVVRDWGIYHRAFVYDLSPWDDEAPLDDPDQDVGTDHETLTMIYEIMLEQTRDTAPFEVCGFFEHQKYSKAGNNTNSNHGTVATEWQYAKMMTPYNGYHNTCIDAAWNESFHGLYEVKQLENNRPTESVELEKDVVYLCFFMGDYDSTHPVYRYLKQAWDDSRRGEMPFAWAINPNLIETYPDLIEYYYETATDNDYFVSDASAAGYFMPNQVPEELWPKMLEHNLKYFKLADMSLAPMVLDTDHMSELALKYMSQIAPDGLGTVSQKKNFMYKDTVVTALLGGGYDRYDPEKGAENLAKVIDAQFSVSNSGASLCMLRCVWSTPTVMCKMVELYKEANPDKEVVVVDIYTYFDLMRQDLEWK